jgi:hypothetical protein
MPADIHGVRKEAPKPKVRPRKKVGDKIIMPNVPDLLKNRKGKIIAVYPTYYICEVEPNGYLECINR